MLPARARGGPPGVIRRPLLRDHKVNALLHHRLRGTPGRGASASKLWRGSGDLAGTAFGIPPYVTDWHMVYKFTSAPHESCCQRSTDHPRRPHTPASHMANRDKAPSRAARADRERPGMVGAIVGEHPGTQRVLGGSGLYRAAGAGAGPDLAAGPDHPRRPDARHARVRGVPHAPERSAVQRHHPDRHHHLGTLRPHPAARGVPRRRVGVPRPAARRRGAAAQAEHLSPVQAGSGRAPRGESARSRHRALQHAGAVPPRARDRRRGVPPPRSHRLRRVRARRRGRRRPPVRTKRKPGGWPTRWRCCSARRDAPRMPSGVWANPSTASSRRPPARMPRSGWSGVLAA